MNNKDEIKNSYNISTIKPSNRNKVIIRIPDN